MSSKSSSTPYLRKYTPHTASYSLLMTTALFVIFGTRMAHCAAAGHFERRGLKVLVVSIRDPFGVPSVLLGSWLDAILHWAFVVRSNRDVAESVSAVALFQPGASSSILLLRLLIMYYSPECPPHLPHLRSVLLGAWPKPSFSMLLPIGLFRVAWVQ